MENFKKKRIEKKIKKIGTLAGSLPSGWRQQLDDQEKEPYFNDLLEFLEKEYFAGGESSGLIYPKFDFIYRALQEVDFDQVRVVILGQDPYHGPGQAIGLSFGVPNQFFPKPPSLKNIFKEISGDLGVSINPKNSELSHWAKEGVLLLNSVLTVRANQAFSHRDKGWEIFTNRVIEVLSAREKPVVFILWGASARSKKILINQARHSVIESAHPSPLSASRGFLGSKPFSKANKILVEKLGLKPIHWEKTF
jgi:uracil-DNA glycosylase